MKLELKHLAPYLPYRLKIRCGEISHPILNCADTNEFEIAIKEVFINSTYKPILRPLSDLTKEIEVNGEKFVPLDWFDKNYAPLECSHQEMKKHFMKDTLKTMPYLVIEKLIEWHFDVFGLIPLNLAIDINTLQNGTD